MPAVSITFEGLDEARERFLEVDANLHRPLRPLLEARGADMAAAFQENIHSRGDRLADRGVHWPSLHPATQKIRRHYGYGGDDPRLIRGGQLLHSLGVLDLGESYVEVGSRLPYARTVHLGGLVVDPKSGRTRTVQAFPFVLPSRQDADDWLALIADYFLEGDDA